MDSQGNAANSDEFPTQCAYCLRDASSGARLLTQMTTTGRPFSYCENTFACALAEADLKAALSESFPDLIR